MQKTNRTCKLFEIRQIRLILSAANDPHKLFGIRYFLKKVHFFAKTESSLAKVKVETDNIFSIKSGKKSFFLIFTVEILRIMDYNGIAIERSGFVLNLVLVEPEIPQNTGNIARTAAATRSRLHLVRPLGFDISEKAVRRAGLDYWPMVDLHVWDNLDDLFAAHPEAKQDLWLATTKAPQDYSAAQFSPDSWLFFGKETAGLPLEFRQAHAQRCIRIPMYENARSLNLANSVAILTYEALRQNGFPGLLGEGEMSTGRVF
jgi:tRNA (cytidine/uridine-2'-O-)-methyltransferase